MCTNAFSELGATKYDRGYKDRETRHKEKHEQSQVLSFRGFLGKLYLFFPPCCAGEEEASFPQMFVCLYGQASLPLPRSRRRCQKILRLLLLRERGGVGGGKRKERKDGQRALRIRQCQRKQFCPGQTWC